MGGGGGVGCRICTGSAQGRESGRVSVRELSVFGFLGFPVRRDIFGGCNLRQRIFLFDVREIGKGSVNIV